MARPRTRRPRPYQLTIDDLDIGWEHIPGAVPADSTMADAARTDFYRGYVSTFGDDECVPDQKIHVYPIRGTVCICKSRKDKQ